MNVSAHACPCHLRLCLLLISLPRSVGVDLGKIYWMGFPYRDCSGPMRTTTPDCEGPVICDLLAPFIRPDCECPLEPLPPMRPDACAELCSGLLGNRVVPVPRLSKRPPLHDASGARGILAHMEHVHSGSRTGASHSRARTPYLPGCRPGRHRGASPSWAPSPAPWEALQLGPRLLVTPACHLSLQLLSLRVFGIPIFFLPPVNRFASRRHPVLRFRCNFYPLC